MLSRLCFSEFILQAGGFRKKTRDPPSQHAAHRATSPTASRTRKEHASGYGSSSPQRIKDGFRGKKQLRKSNSSKKTPLGDSNKPCPPEEPWPLHQMPQLQRGNCIPSQPNALNLTSHSERISSTISLRIIQCGPRPSHARCNAAPAWPCLGAQEHALATAPNTPLKDSHIRPPVWHINMRDWNCKRIPGAKQARP